MTISGNTFLSTDGGLPLPGVPTTPLVSGAIVVTRTPGYEDQRETDCVLIEDNSIYLSGVYRDTVAIGHAHHAMVRRTNIVSINTPFVGLHFNRMLEGTETPIGELAVSKVRFTRGSYETQKKIYDHSLALTPAQVDALDPGENYNWSCD